MKNWKTNAVASLGLIVGVLYLLNISFGIGKVNGESATAALLVLVTLGNFVSKDYDKGSNAPSHQADEVVEKAYLRNGPAPPRNIENVTEEK